MNIYMPPALNCTRARAYLCATLRPKPLMRMQVLVLFLLLRQLTVKHLIPSLVGVANSSGVRTVHFKQWLLIGIAVIDHMHEMWNTILTAQYVVEIKLKQVYDHANVVLRQ